MLLFFFFRYHGMGGAVALLAAKQVGSMALPLAKDCNHRTLPEVLNSLKVLPYADRFLIHPILAEAILEKYGQKNSPELEYLRKLESVEVGGGKLSTEVARALRDMGINVVSMPAKKCQKFGFIVIKHSFSTVFREA
jgi:hypothetical protein